MGNGDVDDLELHRRLSAGDRDAFDALYHRYAPTAYGLAYRLTKQAVADVPMPRASMNPTTRSTSSPLEAW